MERFMYPVVVTGKQLPHNPSHSGYSGSARGAVHTTGPQPILATPVKSPLSKFEDEFKNALTYAAKAGRPSQIQAQDYLAAVQCIPQLYAIDRRRAFMMVLEPIVRLNEPQQSASQKTIQDLMTAYGSLSTIEMGRVFTWAFEKHLSYPPKDRPFYGLGTANIQKMYYSIPSRYRAAIDLIFNQRP